MAGETDLGINVSSTVDTSALERLKSELQSVNRYLEQLRESGATVGAVWDRLTAEAAALTQQIREIGGATRELKAAEDEAARNRLYDLQRQLDIASQIGNYHDNLRQKVRATATSHIESWAKSQQANEAFQAQMLRAHQQRTAQAEGEAAAEEARQGALQTRWQAATVGANQATLASIRLAAEQKRVATAIQESTVEARGGYQGLIDSITGVNVATTDLIEKQRELEAAFAGVRTETHTSFGAAAAATEGGPLRRFFSTYIRRGGPMITADELLRGQKGQFEASIGATSRAAGLGMSGMGVMFGGIAAIGAASAIIRTTSAMSRLALSESNAAAAAGMSIQQYDHLSRTLEILGGKSATIDRVFDILTERMNAALRNPQGNIAQAFSQMGIGAKTLAEDLRNPIDMLTRLRHAYQAGDRPQVVEVLRRQLPELIPLLSATDQQFAATAEAVRLNGSSLADNAAKLRANEIAVRQLSDAWTQLKAAIASVVASSGLTDWLRNATIGITHFAQAVGAVSTQLAELVRHIPFIGKSAANLIEAHQPNYSGLVPSLPTSAGQLMQYLEQRHGYTPTQAAAVAGQAARESSFKPTAGLGTAHQGLFQESAYHWAQLQEFAKASGRSPLDWHTQADFFVKQIQRHVPDFKSMTNLGTMTSALTRKVEVPGHYGTEIPIRLGFAQKALQQYGAGIPPAPPEGPVPGPPIHTVATQLHAAMSSDIRTTRQAAQLHEAQIAEQIAAASGNATKIAALEAQRAKLADDEVKAEEAIRAKYAAAATKAGVPAATVGQQFGPDYASQTRAVEVHTQVIRAAQQQKNQEYRSFIAAERAKIAAARNASEQNVAAAQSQQASIDAIYSEMLAKAESTYGQDSAQYQALIDSKIEADRRFASEHASQQLAALRHSYNATSEYDRIQHQLSQVTIAQQGGGGRNQGLFAEIRQRQTALNDAATAVTRLNAEIAQLQKLASTPGIDPNIARQANQEILQDTSTTLNQLTQDYRQANQVAKEFGATISSSMTQAANGILNALMNPQQTIIHAGMTTIVQNNYGQQIMQALGQALSGLATKLMDKLVMDPIGNMIESHLSGLFGASANATASSGLQMVATAAMKAATALGMLAPQTTTASAAHMSNAAAVNTGTASQTVNSTAVRLASTAHTTNTMSTTLNTSATTSNTVATQMNSAAQSSGGLMGALGKIPLIGGLLGMFSGGGIIPSAAGGLIVGGLGNLGNGTLAVLHPNEMVLPANISAGIQGMIGRGGGGGPVSNTASLNYSPTINTGSSSMSKSDLASMLSSHAGTLIGEARNLVTRGFRG